MSVKVVQVGVIQGRLKMKGSGTWLKMFKCLEYQQTPEGWRTLVSGYIHTTSQNRPQQRFSTSVIYTVQNTRQRLIQSGSQT